MKKFLINYFLFLLLTLSLICSGVLDSQDGFLAMAISRNFYYTGKPSQPPYEYKERKNIHMTTGTGIGYSIAMIPAVAMTDFLYKIYNVKPPVHFPLENDWLILLLGSVTNVFFASILGVVMFLFFIELKLTKKQALIMSLVTIFATNLLSYAKYSFAHMMFSAFLVLAFYLVKKYFLTNKKKFLVFAGLSYGTMLLSYNGSFLLTLPALVIYFILLGKYKIHLNSVMPLVKKFFYFLLGLLPLLIIFKWFESFRSGSQADPGFYINYAKTSFSRVPISMFIEGFYGQLLSPGRSIFIYSPILITIIFFWHKIKKNFIPELIAFLLLALFYIPFYALQVSWGDGGDFGPKGYTGLWHGESSWGPRYLIPIVPFGLLIVGSIFQKLSKLQKYLIFLPLILVGIYIQLLGIIMPYQIKVHNIDKDFYVNETQITNFVYSDLIPRYNPILLMTRNLKNLAKSLPKTLDHGEYNVKFYDGIDFPFNVGQERWRSIEGKGYISFDNSKKDPIKKMSFGLINHPLRVSSSSAIVNFKLNGQQLFDKQPELLVTERKIIDIPIKQEFLKAKENRLEIELAYNPPFKEEHAQLLAIIAYQINGKPVNMESLDFPYYSPLGPAMVNAKYNTYGREITDPWRFWDLHTQLYEKTPDFWWIKTLYYWDYPRQVIGLIFTALLISSIFFGFNVFYIIRKEK